MRRSREEVEQAAGKKARQRLALVPLPLAPEELGFSVGVNGELGPLKTGKSPKK